MAALLSHFLRIVVLLLVVAFGSTPVRAQTCQWSPEFSIPGIDGWIHAAVAMDDGNGTALWVGGYFKSAGVLPVDGLAKWDGVTWSAIPGGLEGTVLVLSLHDLGSGPALYAGGAFRLPGSLDSVYLAKWNGSGWTPVVNGPEGIVRSLATFNDGSGTALYAAGNFATAGGVTVNNVARWNGTSWSALGTGLEDVDGLEVRALKVFDRGDGAALYAGGSFTIAGGASSRGIAQWDGSSWSAVGSGFDGLVAGFEVFDDGTGSELYVSGYFYLQGSVRRGIAKWDGFRWDTALGSDIFQAYATAVVQGETGPELYVAAYFFSASALRVARWDGSSWNAAGGIFSGNMITTLYPFDDGTGEALLAGGNFWEAGSSPASSIARWRGTDWEGLKTGIETSPRPPGRIRAMTVFDDGDGPALYATGETSWNSSGNGYLARWKGGNSWDVLASGSINPWVLEVLDDGNGPALYTDSFEGSGSRPRKYDASGWTSLPANPLAVSRDFAFLDTGGGLQLYSAGTSTSGGGAIARLENSSWLPLMTFDEGVQALASFDDGSGIALYVGGLFTDFNGNKPGLLRSNGSGWSTVGNWEALQGDDGYVWSLEVLDDGTGPALYTGFNSIGSDGSRTSPVAKWDGAFWQSLGETDDEGPDAVHAMTVFDDGTGKAIYAGFQYHWEPGLPPGVFPGTYTGSSSAYESLYKWEHSSWRPLTEKPLFGVFDMAVFDDGQGPALFAGGEMTNVDGITSRNLAKYTCSPQVDLVVALTDGVSVAEPGGEVTYRLLVRNLGTVADPAARLRNTVTSGMNCSYTSIPAGGATGNTASGHGILDETLSMPRASAVTYTVRCTVPTLSSSALHHVAVLTASISDRNLENNTATDINAFPIRLTLPLLTQTAETGYVDIPVSLSTGGQDIAATVFSLDYDPACLDPDSDDDGVLDQVTLAVPGAFTPIVRFDPLDSDGEIDISLVDWSPPIEALDSGELLKIRFLATCPAATTAVDSPILFSAQPAPTFGGTSGQNIPGTSSGGLVRILPGPRGDCNGDHSLGAGDLVAVGLEIFDGDGEFWLDTPAPAFAGSPVGCDANASTLIRAADVVCANLLIFGDGCSGAESLLPGAPRVEVSTAFDGSVNWIRARLVPNGAAVGALAYSLDLDPARFAVNRIDANHDGVPDRLRLPTGNPGLAAVAFDRNDADGEIDILLANLSGLPLAAGYLVEIGVPAAGPLRRGAKVSSSPAPSFGSVTGGDLAGDVLDGILLFADGFEAGNIAAWSQASP